MKRWKHLTLELLSAAAAIALLVPRLAMGEFGVCPPYSRTFGADDSAGDLLTFIGEVNARPGGGTAILAHDYVHGSEGVLVVRGVVCIRAAEPESERPYLPLLLRVENGAMLTLRDLKLDVVSDVQGHRVEQDAVLFGERVRLSVQGRAETLPAFFENAGAAYLREVSFSGDEAYAGIENTGTLVMRGGGVEGVVNILSFDGVRNYGYAMLDRVSIANNRSFSGYPRGIVNDGGGVLTLQNSIVVGNSAIGERVSVGATGVVNGSGAVAHVFSSTIAHHVYDGLEDEDVSGLGISNAGYLELQQSIVTDACDPVVDLGYNVGSCAVTHPTSTDADPQFLTRPSNLPPSIELTAGSPAIDLIPLDLCKDTDALGRARTDGDGDGIIACDSGALEYGYAFVEVTVRARPYHWREIGTVDLSVTDLMTMYVFSNETFDATQIDFDSVAIEGFEQDAKGWPWILDVGKDGLLDYQVTWWLNRQPPLPCGYQEHAFSAMTVEGTQVRGLLRFEAVGCAP